MVVFTCDTCGESLRKKDVEKHVYQCRCAFITCVDCSKPFYGDEYVAHTRCITDEQFKYGHVKKAAEEKGLVKQNAWLNNIEILLSDRSLDSRLKPILIEMKRFENVPRKKKPFLNWSKCTMKRFNPRQVEEVFDKLQVIHQNNQRNQNGNSQQNSNAENGQKESKTGSEEEMEVENEADVPAKKSKKNKASDENEDASNGKGDDSEEEEQQKSLEKFKIKKHVAEVLSSKGGKPVKLKRLKKKLVCAYNEYAEQRKEKAKVWSPEDVYSKLNKVLTNKKLFKVQSEIVELTEAGKQKYGLTAAPDGDSD